MEKGLIIIFDKLTCIDCDGDYTRIKGFKDKRPLKIVKKSKKRFEVIKDCNGNTDLVDTENKLITLPLGIDLDSLDDYDLEKLQEWLDLLNR